MNQIPTLILLAGLAGGPLLAADTPAPAPPSAATNAPALTNAASAASAPTAEVPAPALLAQEPPAVPGGNPAPGSAPSPAGVAAAPTPAAGTNDPNCLRLNFRGAPLELVLNYLSEAAGFVIVLETQPRGRVDVWSNQPLTKQEAVDLLNSVLNKNGYAAIRRGRTLTICNKDEAKVKAIPVKLGSEPEKIPDNDEMVTQIIPVRYVEVGQLIKDLTPLVSTQTAMTANESGNSIVITDTQCNIRRVAEIIKAIDMGAEDVTEVKVFHLQYADPNEMSDLLVNLFPDDSRSGGSSAPMQFGGFGGFRRMFGGGGPPGMGGGNNSAGQNQRIKKRARVIAVSDSRTASVVVTAAKDLMFQIEAVV
ncbi:MAG TPA: secretin N-terminal domain-containing protein, partial [Candidatus Sulfotelmatobacter sp.]|nr:secretin N-terminal domain-containing protein [Candidatus Sulfotelmatobacter sp.]